jgi:hypothetical protein
VVYQRPGKAQDLDVAARLSLPATALLALAACRGPALSYDEDTSSDASDGETGETGEDSSACEPWPEPPAALGTAELALEFTDVSAEVGLVDTAYFPGDWPPECDPEGEGWVRTPCKMYLQGAGAAVGDFDDDGWPDIYLSRLVGPGLLFRNRLGAGGNPAFEEVALARGLVDEFGGNGAAWVDVDGDRDLDLYVTSMGLDARFWFYRNQLTETGTANFVEEAHIRSLALDDGEPHFGFSIGVGDYDRDGWLDLYTTEWRPGGAPTQDSSHARLLRNRGAWAPGEFEDHTLEAGASMLMLNPAGLHAFSPTFVDLDEDGWQDLAVVSDNGTSRLFWNQGDGSFVDGTPTAGVSLERNGMGSTFADFDGDGHLDWYVSAIFSPDDDVECGNPVCGRGGNRLYRSIGPRCFEDVAEEYGVHIGGWGWGTAMWDPDNDGDIDIVETNGFQVPHGPPGTYFVGDPMRYWQNESEQLGAAAFTEISEFVGLVDAGQGRGLLTFDYDRDGDEDLLVVDNSGLYGISTKLWRNETGNQHEWLAVELEGLDGNRHGVGARIELRRGPESPVQVRVIGVGTHFLGHGEYRAHFGLGPDAGPVDEVRVLWPSGEVTVVEGVQAGQVLVVAEPE